jgi:site-specific DNA-methyltransferase (cytosine-N4-specific)
MADVTKVLTPYSARMKKLLQDAESFYTPKGRPSGHDISGRFADDNGGAIPSNLLQISNTESNSQYLRYCRAAGVSGHPARFPAKLPEFFVQFLTQPNDIVVDIFAGSNTTGAVCEQLNRRWLAFDLDQEYLAASVFRFLDVSDVEGAALYRRLSTGLADHQVSTALGVQQALIG